MRHDRLIPDSQLRKHQSRRYLMVDRSLINLVLFMTEESLFQVGLSSYKLKPKFHYATQIIKVCAVICGMPYRLSPDVRAFPQIFEI